jgi:hypothetical protein
MKSQSCKLFWLMTKIPTCTAVFSFHYKGCSQVGIATIEQSRRSRSGDWRLMEPYADTLSESTTGVSHSYMKLNLLSNTWSHSLLIGLSIIWKLVGLVESLEWSPKCIVLADLLRPAYAGRGDCSRKGKTRGIAEALRRQKVYSISVTIKLTTKDY